MIYEGDLCFTYGHLLSSVDYLSRRIRRALDGDADSNPRDHNHVLKQKPPPQSGIDGTTSSQRNPKIVGVCIPPSAEYIVSVLSILRCGEAFMPLDPSWPEERILSVVSSSRASLIVRWVMPNQVSDAVDWVGHRSGCAVLYMSMDVPREEQLGQLGLDNLAWPCKAKVPRRFCYLMYTSGSTGKPKGVCGTEEGILNRFCWMQKTIPLSREEVLLFKTSISFVDHLQELLSGILTCRTLIVPSYEELKASPLHIINFLKEYRISRLTSVPSLIRAIITSSETHLIQIRSSLNVLILSGEIFSISLWKNLHELLPETTILNLYGSTEVSGDCTYFNCKNLSHILASTSLSSVPIGFPIANCETVLASELDTADEGEIHVTGSCLFAGYYGESMRGESVNDEDCTRLFKTGDFARRLESGELVFIGRKDRMVKVSGQRISLDEIESTLRDHPDISDAAVTSHRSIDSVFIEAYFIPKNTQRIEKEHVLPSGISNLADELILSLRNWLSRKLTLAMLPSYCTCMEMFPTFASGKIDYTKLPSSPARQKRLRIEVENNNANNHLRRIKEVFRDTLAIDEVSDHADFFLMGGNSISAAQAAHKLGIDMRMLYTFSTPFKLQNSLLNIKHWSENYVSQFSSNEKKVKLVQNLFYPTGVLQDTKVVREDVQDLCTDLYSNKSDILLVTDKAHLCTMVSTSFSDLKYRNSVKGGILISKFDSNVVCSFSRCNQFVVGCIYKNDNFDGVSLSFDIPLFGIGSLQELWRVPLMLCVDASPLIVVRDEKIRLFIGSHANIFLCIDALSGSVQWTTALEDRIECSAAVTGDFSEVVVGCYKGKIYFLELTSGNITWIFQTNGEVKMQPVVDICRNLIWCGSYDQCLYALDYKRHCCRFKISCGGSLYSSPAIDTLNDMVYVASTRGIITAISVKVEPYKTEWKYDTGAAIFSSLALYSQNGLVVCCLVNGHVIALDSKGRSVWKAITGGPIFAGACISKALPSQVIVCSRDSNVYSFNLEGGALLWKYHVGDPITSSPYVDEFAQFTSEQPNPSYRFACICSSSGNVLVLRIGSSSRQRYCDQGGNWKNASVQEAGRMNLPGEIFSSPVMIGGRIFVGCRDDYVHCIGFQP